MKDAPRAGRLTGLSCAGDDSVDEARRFRAPPKASVKALTSILEPVMIILVGGIVGFIVIAMYMPMFKVYDAIK